jgi:succinoglycan biosynthesis transport protein ExoP
MALAGGHVILVDCDLRNPSLSRKLAPEAKLGILDVLSGDSSLEAAIWSESDTKMSFLPVVDRRSMLNSGDILAAPATRKLFDELRGKYDYVIVDLPPLVPIVDVRAASGLVDSFIFVIEWGRTKIDMTQHALKNAFTVHENIMGAVLNKVDMALIGRYERKDAKYHKSASYARYGYRH